MTICIVDQYFSINKIFLRAVALWPYHRTKFNEFQWFFFLVILITFILAQLATFLTTECTPNMTIKIMSLALSFTLYLIKYVSFRVNADTIRYILERCQYMCDELTDEGEIAIIKECGHEAKRFTMLMLLYGASNIMITCFLPVFPRILRTFTSINMSGEQFMIDIMREYFVDQDKYYYYILLHMDVSYIIGIIVIPATGSLLFGGMKYICGLFKIASYRIDQTMETPMFQSAGFSKDYVIYKKIVHAVDIHRKATELSDKMISDFVGTCCLIMLVSVTSLSLNLYGVHQAMMLGSAMKEYLVHVKCISVSVMYMFIGNYIGQEITDYHNHIFSSIYNMKWYGTSLYIQRIILFMVQRGTENFYIVFAGMFVLSMENAAMLFSTSISYFTVLHSIQ
ncbi:hypothetical protein DMN91_006261 [Ooceraea biroi]|uniref:Odorant receptor n=1 Tax=Ooceraea biroi TaxID=2015173 RepID=A0A026VTB5_OOCBI|nr:uncharacterized protein LOC105287191 isoform X2 [Ooceraea biroi]EZA46731.1 hypothetical protein X777_02391 [Ooceraea biroi]RLU21884.1 hypothetical protein DMN91_006261 [Ooceraea biroi]